MKRLKKNISELGHTGPPTVAKSAHAHVPYKKRCGVCIYATHILLYTLNHL